MSADAAVRGTTAAKAADALPQAADDLVRRVAKLIADEEISGAARGELARAVAATQTCLEAAGSRPRRRDVPKGPTGQRQAALGQANAKRFAVADCKRAIVMAGAERYDHEPGYARRMRQLPLVLDVLLRGEGDVLTIKVDDLIGCMWRISRARHGGTVLRAMQLRPNARVRDLTARQRHEIAERIERLVQVTGRDLPNWERDVLDWTGPLGPRRAPEKPSGPAPLLPGYLDLEIDHATL